MHRIDIAAGILAVWLIGSASAWAQDCEPLRPSRTIDTEIRNVTEAKANILLRSLGQGSIKNDYQHIEQNQQFKNPDDANRWSSFIYMLCTLLKSSSSLSDKDKFDQYFKLVELSQQSPPPPPTPPATPEGNVLCNSDVSSLYFLDGKWKVSVRGTQQSGFAVVLSNGLWPDRYQTASYIWDIYHDDKNVYIRSKKDPDAYPVTTLEGQGYDRPRTLNICGTSRDGKKLAFKICEPEKICELGQGEGVTSFAQVEIEPLPSNGANSINGKWQYKYREENTNQGSQSAQKNGDLQMIRKKQ